MEYLSPSKLKRFRTCPHQCKHEPFKRNPAVDFGNAVHKGLAAILAGKDFWAAYRGEAGKLAIPKEKEEDAKACLEFAESLNVDTSSIITIESADGDVEFYGNKYFQVELGKEWGIRGAMDAVFVDNNGGLVILDWKTGQSKEEDDLQLAMYALAAWKKYGQFPYIVTKFAYVQQGFTQTTSWDAETLVGALEYLKPLAEDYLKAQKENKWPQTPHKWCKYCDLKESCEAYNKQLAAKPDRASYDIEPTLENLPRILEYHDKVKAIADAAYSIQALMKEKYEKVLTENGKITLDGRTFELKEKVSRYNYDLPVIFGATQEIIGRPPLELCEYSSNGAKLIEKQLDKENKKLFKAIIESNREVKSKSITMAISIAKEAPQEIDAGGQDIEGGE
jgi:RecB family exonuclease